MNKMIWYILSFVTYTVFCFVIVTWCNIIEIKLYGYSQYSAVDDIVGCILAGLITKRLYRWMKWM
jgi:hypothetical protein